MARRLLLTIPVAVAALLVLYLGSGEEDTRRVFHVTLADPDQYTNGIYTDSFLAGPGLYVLQFVPNGDSPPVLSVSMEGQDVSFRQDYRLRGTLHQTEISEYHTWEYLGPDQILVRTGQHVTITIDPNGRTAGSVSVSLIRQ